MLIITPEAVRYLKDKGEALYLDHPSASEAANRTFKELPTLKFGVPQRIEDFEIVQEDGATVYVPRAIWHIPMSLAASSFLGFKKLFLRLEEGKRGKRSN